MLSTTRIRKRYVRYVRSHRGPEDGSPETDPWRLANRDWHWACLCEDFAQWGLSMEGKEKGPYLEAEPVGMLATYMHSTYSTNFFIAVVKSKCV